MGRTPEQKAQHAEYMRNWRRDNPEEAREVERRRRQAIKDDPERLERYRKYQREHARKDARERPEVRRAYTHARRLRIEYDLTVEQYNEMLLAQGGQCAICGEIPTNDARLHVDHCHETGRVRGLLCFACNWALGLLRDDPGRLAAAMSYLRR